MHMRQKALILQLLLFKSKKEVFRMKNRFWNSAKDSKSHERERLQSESRTFIEKKQRYEKKKNSENENENNSSNSSNVEENMNYAFAIVDDSIFSSKTFSKSKFFRFSWILNHATTIHVCNDIMTHRFIKKRDENERIVTAENCEWTIQLYDHIVIKRQEKFEIKEMILLNVCYIFEFMTNLISKHILIEKDVHFMSETKRLYRNEKTIVYAIKKNDHFYIKNNDDENQNFESENENFDKSTVLYSAYYSQTFSDVKQRTTQNWHQILAHAENEIIQNLEKSIQEIKISNDKKTSKTNECETCALSKAHQIIFRFNQKSEFSKEKSFHRVTYDLMQLNSIMNKDQWISHLACFENDFNLVFTHSRKSNATNIVKKGLKIMQTKFNARVMFFRTNDEKSLKKKFDEMLSDLKITYELFALYTSEQNNHSERKENVLAMKTRTMRIQANFSKYLWSWIARVVDFIMNKTLMKKHSWKISFERVINNKFNIFHLHKFECRAYFFDKSIFKKNKLRERAHIEYLLKYDDSNIYFIWISNQQKVIRTKDVIFDESIYYDSSEIDVVKLLKSMIELLIETSDIEQNARIIEIESKSESDSKVKQISISSSNMKEKKIEIKNNQKVFHQLLIFESKSKSESYQFSHIEFSAISVTSRASEIAYQSLIERRTASKNIRSTIEKTNIIFQEMNRIKRMKKKHMR